MNTFAYGIIRRTRLRLLVWGALALLAAGACNKGNGADSSSLEELYDSVDAEMLRSEIYQNQKEARIAILREELARENDEHIVPAILDRLIGEYESYVSDSALYYVNRSLQAPANADKPHTRASLLIRKADISSHAGLFADAIAIMESVPREHLDSTLLEQYYSTYCGIYQYQSEYDNESEFSEVYERQRALYSDSVAMVAAPGSLNHIITAAPELIRVGMPDSAVSLLRSHLDEYTSGTRPYSILASILANVYKNIGETENYKRYLALSTISDIRGVVKENMAVRELSTVIFEEGDIERANRYLKQSFADANFFAARMRNAQSGRMLPIIDEAYAASQNKMQRELRWQMGAISLLVVILALALILILKQVRAARRAGAKLSQRNEELSGLSEQLREANRALASMNDELKESNTIKEEYAAMFMEYCSSTISTLQQYHQSLRVLAAQSSRTALNKKLESSEMIDTALRDFYSRFDEAILNIYPSFVEKFNSLLKPDCRTVLKSGEFLNTELRVFALIRIGITDSAKIAGFLRCSITTVYTYRSKVRRRALRPESFETEVMTIG